MPQVARVAKFSVFVYTEDHAPAHVHVRFGRCSVRVLITETGVVLDKKLGRPSAADVRSAVKAVADNLDTCNAKWKEIHG